MTLFQSLEWCCSIRKSRGMRGDTVGYLESYYHLVWATKGREPIIDQMGERVIDGSFRRTCREADVIVRAIGIMPDHVHLALSVPPRWSVSELVKELKVSATHMVRKTPDLPYAQSFAWQHEFGMFTFGRASQERIINYVMNQREHHANQTLNPLFEQITQPGSSD